jgi:hypothetical protein
MNGPIESPTNSENISQKSMIDTVHTPIRIESDKPAITIHTAVRARP